ncbi:MAG: peptide chain release factor N(5)-glutamine methyltransferase [Candidatus Marinimicrobia bacterium]|nr:peptide chain release factor N(5)-glutamine methyltransferase [Candidatus Neomarinimicrobiota bacterium]
MASCSTKPSIKQKKQHWRIIEILKWGEEYFASKGFESPKREIEWLLVDLLSLPRIDLYLQFDQLINSKDLVTLKSWIKRRLNHEPLQYITGKTEFYGIPIKVNPHVLIPRPETERLVEIALKLAEDIDAKEIVDVGTGSGCIAIALAANLKHVKILATDNSERALQVAQRNAEQNAVVKNIQFAKLDILTEDLEGPFDILVSNPPYVRQDEVSTLMPEIRDYEPIGALTDGADGLDFYRRFAAIARKCVREGGFLALEVGLNPHPQQVREIFEEAGFEAIEFFKDYNGDDRVITIKITL